MSSSPSLPARLALFLALLSIALGSLWLSRPREKAQEFRTDEAEWLTIAVAHFQQLRGAGDPWSGLPAPEAGASRDPQTWREGVHDATFGAMNPGVGKLLLGGLLHLGGLRDWDPDVFRRFSGPDRERRLAARELVRPGLASGRLLSLFAAALIAVLLFYCGQRVARAPAGLAAFGLWLATPLVQQAAWWVRTDLLPLAFGFASLALLLGRSPALSGRRGVGASLLSALLVGVLAGAAAGAKLSGALFAVALVPALPMIWLGALGRERLSFSAGPGPALLLAGVASLGVFISTCPALRGSPGEVIEIQGSLLRDWRGDMRGQQLIQEQRAKAGDPGAVPIARSRREAARLALQGTLERHEPLAALSGVPLGFGLVPGGLLVLLSALRERGRRRERVLATLATLATIAVGTALWLPGAWDRFYLPLVAVAVLLEGALIGWLLGRLRPTR